MDQQVDPQTAEEWANEAVDCIRQFVEVLRAEFLAQNQSTRVAGTFDVPPNNVPLYTRMVDRGLMDQLQRTIQRQGRELSISESLLPSSQDGLCGEDQRTLLLKQFILPVLRSLTRCYRVLDDIPQPQSSLSTIANKNKRKPEPPRGMLSLQQYTDIACLLEFTVCSFILPLLDPHVLTPLQDRIRHYLPKSLAGRIPRTALRWGVGNGTNGDVLLETAIELSNLILLDRFRPMLLPRHIADIFAAVFQYEQHHDTSSQATPELLSLYRLWGLQTIGNGPDIPPQMEATLHAKAYQTLLLQGTNTPIWLRKRVGPLLTELACTNMAAIVQVFVPLQQQYGEVSSMASQRLGQTLATASASNIQSAQRLAEQIRLLLEVVFPMLEGEQIPPQVMAILQTIWAVLNHWPKDLMQQQIIETWQRGLLMMHVNNDYIVHKTLRQIGSLCASVPPSATEPWRIVQELFRRPSTDLGLPNISIMTLLLRLASMPNVVVKSRASEEARRIIHWLCQATASSTVLSTPTSGHTFLAMAWMDALAPNEWDIDGNAYRINELSTNESSARQDSDRISNSKSQTSIFEQITIQKITTNGQTDITLLMGGITKRAEAFFESCLEHSTPESADTALQGMTSIVFRLLLKLYFTEMSGITPSKFEIHWRLQLVPIVLIPILCEKCSPEALLFGPGSDTDALGLLDSIKLVLTCAKARLDRNPDMLTDASPFDALATSSIEVQGEQSKDDDNGDTDTIVRCMNFLNGGDIQDHLGNSGVSLQADSEQEETLLSISSIVLSLLIAVLELGSKLRSYEEERALQSFLPILAVLAEFRNKSNTSNMMNDQRTNAGISDMAGYAMALIAARKAEPTPELTSETPPSSIADKAKAIIDQARKDLDSTQPPIRARGMVSLGRLARGYLGILNPKEAKPKLVIDLGEDDSLEDELINYTIHEILTLSIPALSDSESYVYLAAIQTIVAIGDLRPRQVLPKLGATLVTGQIDGISSLSNEQLVKLAEALMLIIRRRAAPTEFLPQLVNNMIFGSEHRIGATIDHSIDNNQKLFAVETEKYFTGDGLDEDESVFFESNKERWKEQDIRAKTGGPVFALEESDLVRSIRLSVIAELVSVSPPSTLAPYTRLLIRLINDVLYMDASRNTCRAAALLAREFYGCLLRESEGLNEEMQGQVPSLLSMAVAVVSSAEEEELLIVTLQNCCNGKGNHVYDPATVARCQEALELRVEAEDLLVVARLVDAQQHSFNVPRVLTTMVREKPRVIEIDKLKSLD